MKVDTSGNHVGFIKDGVQISIAGHWNTGGRLLQTAALHEFFISQSDNAIHEPLVYSHINIFETFLTSAGVTRIHLASALLKYA